MSDAPVRLVCLDLGGVVMRICRTWAEGCAAAGLEVREPQRWAAARPARWDLVMQLQAGRIDGLTFATRASALVEGLYSPAEILAVHRAWILGEYDGIGALLDRLHGAGLDTAALSNTNHLHWSQLAAYPSPWRLGSLLASHQLGLYKPDPAIYHRLERQLGYAGREILFFDDTPENVDAARRVGWRAEVIDPTTPTPPQIEAALAAHGAPL